MFGFSRGAFTAKFLARMIATVGLLCKGNEELVPFAYRLYQRYLAGELETISEVVPSKKAHDINADDQPVLDGCGDEHSGTAKDLAQDEITAFSSTFCRKELVEVDGEVREENVKVYFLGIWDCVNSVAVFEGTTPVPVPVEGIAHFIRHAVAVDERRVKFKPSLLSQDIRCSHGQKEDIKEVWFPGAHGDVGGGWPASDNDNLEDMQANGPSLWTRIKMFWRTNKPKQATRDVRKDAFQLSDVPLSWMIRELEHVAKLDPKSGVKWSYNAEGYKRAFAKDKSQKQALKGLVHDSLSFSSGSGFFTVLLWKIMGKHEPLNQIYLDPFTNNTQNIFRSSLGGSWLVMNGSTCDSP